jgi:hypothetical protein
MNIHYSIKTGAIMAYGTADDTDGADSYLPDCKVLVIDTRPIDPRRQRIDPATREIVDMPDATTSEKVAAPYIIDAERSKP